MYKIIGGDGKAYGPVEAEQLRRWIAEGRLNASSLAQREGATEWLALGSFPEFVDALQTRERPYQAVPPGAPVPPGVREAWKAEVLARLRLIDEAGSRTSAEEHEIRRRVALYQRRADGIESRFPAVTPTNVAAEGSRSISTT